MTKPEPDENEQPPRTNFALDESMEESTMNEIPRCDYIPMWSSTEHRCPNDAAFKVFRSHGAGINPVYKDRCLQHTAGAFGPAIAAYWDPDREKWRPTD